MDKRMDFQEEINKRLGQIDGIIKSYLPAQDGYQKKVIEAMNYSVLAGGKRLRSMIMQETYHLFGGKSQVIEPFMAAMEMIHTYSLVHDDLPSMDNDEYRRGKKTTHVVYGEAMAILAGDGLLNFAFETALKAFDLEPDNKNISKALGVLAGKAGIFGMIGGQTVDVETKGENLDLEQLNFVYRLKTSALLEASMMIGAILAGATKNEQKVLELTAQDIGLAFQIQDDILDVVGNEEELGKSIGSDEKNNKVTYVKLKGLETAKEDVEIISANAVNRMSTLVVKNEFLNQLILHLVSRNK